MYCVGSHSECKFTMARKQRPFYYASEEQFRWLQIIASKIDPDANLNDISHLKALAASLDGSNVIKREPENIEERRGRSPDTPGNVEPEEGMEGVVDGIGTLMLDPLGRQSIFHITANLGYIGESASLSFHRKVRDYVHSQRPGGHIADRFPDPQNYTETVDLVNADGTPDAIADTPSFGSPRSVFSAPISLRARLPPRHLADLLIDRFFDQVHSIFWVFPRDQFTRQLDKTYMLYSIDYHGGSPRCYDDQGRKEVEAPSWLCCVFTTLALGCSTDDHGTETLKPSDLFSHAKALSRFVVEDESIQSIQALLLMVIPGHG
jgi:hypothetical protein